MARQREIPAGQFRARCLALLDEVASSGEELVVTKRGRPVARVVPIETSSAEGERSEAGQPGQPDGRRVGARRVIIYP